MGLIQWVGGYALMFIGGLIAISGLIGANFLVMLVGAILTLIGAYYKKIATK